MRTFLHNTLDWLCDGCPWKPIKSWLLTHLTDLLLPYLRPRPIMATMVVSARRWRKARKGHQKSHRTMGNHADVTLTAPIHSTTDVPVEVGAI